jgi:hypothetical protein
VVESLAERYEDTADNVKGIFDPGTKEIAIRKDAQERAGAEGFAGFTLAHEAGHAADAGQGLRNLFGGGLLVPRNPSEFAESDLASEQLDRLSARARGIFRPEQTEEGLSDLELYDDEEYVAYRETVEERLADAIALNVLEPRAARREAPELAEFLRERVF